ncbi:inducible T-cell costimulator [Crotalus adamanteus]|uniref:Inducible T-cell costimulator n=1 Tax=Crotalus adamanteus TaxID=8729 RepID=A0AAW1C979_CROAD
MKIGIVTFCLLCCCFEALHGVNQCSSISSCTTSCTENIMNHPQQTDEFPRENFTLNCPLPSNVKEVLTPVYRCCKANEKHLYVQDSEKSCWLSELMSWILIGLTVFLFVACIFSSIMCFRSAICQCANTYDNNTEYMSMAAVKLG